MQVIPAPGRDLGELSHEILDPIAQEFMERLEVAMQFHDLHGWLPIQHGKLVGEVKATPDVFKLALNEFHPEVSLMDVELCRDRRAAA